MSFEITLRVARSQPHKGKAFSEFHLTLEDRMTVLDALFLAQRTADGSLGFRCSCRVGMCGTCAVYVNLIPRLACGTRVKNLGSRVLTVEPLPGYPVIKDVAVSLEPFFEQWRRVHPALHPKNADSPTLAVLPSNSKYRQLTPTKRDCITCGACFAACSFTRMNESYLGPAAINKAFLRMLDPRDDAVQDRLKILDENLSGVWRCHTQFNCTAVCPRGIDLTDSIVRIKRALLSPGSVFGP